MVSLPRRQYNRDMATSQKMTDVVPQILIALGLTLIVIIGMNMVRADATSSRDGGQPVTYHNHDTTTIESFRSQYVGDNSNTVQLLYALPLGPRIDWVEIHETAVDVVLTDAPDVDPQAERDDVLYSAVAFFAAVDNGSALTYRSPEAEYSVTRQDVEARFGAPLSDLLDSAAEWKRVRTLIPIEADSLVSEGAV